MPFQCVLIADDLTGACDAAVQFSARGAKSVVHVGWDNPAECTAEVNAFSTDSRDVTASEMEARIRRVASFFSDFRPRVVFKKIDSVMRGNPGREILVAADAFACELAIITPAFPDMGRRVHQGLLHVHGDDTWTPLNVLATLQNQGLADCRHMEPGLIAAAIRDGTRYISLDATCNEDLSAIVRETLRAGRRVLWAGSGGLASALAKVLFCGEITRDLRGSGRHRPVLFCIGSDHPVTLAQVETLETRRSALGFDAGLAKSSELGRALADGQHVILRILRETSPERIRELLDKIEGVVGAMLLSGGDTASVVCEAVDAQAIEVENQIVTGLPAGVLCGGLFEGLPVATKSGGFGEADALVRVADFFVCPN